MKRIWASVVISVVSVFLCVIGIISTQSISHDMTRTLIDAKREAENGNNNKAHELSQKAVNDWKQKHEILCVYMPHSRLEAIDQTLSTLPSYIYYGTTDQFEAECDRGITQIEYLNEAEIPNIQNIF
ncbi:MAG TPA: DUF4363 family protein [Caproiciproducens sp.]|nr:DUF4363 family protein [Caproiciproducens sp.]